MIRCFDQVALKMSKQTKQKKAWLKCDVTLVIDDSSTLIIYIPWTNRVFTCPYHEKKGLNIILLKKKQNFLSTNIHLAPLEMELVKQP